jgi:hypothetical protein
MDELLRRLGGAEGPAEYVMKPIRLEETRMSGLDDYLIDPKVSLLGKKPIRGAGPLPKQSHSFHTPPPFRWIA